MRRGVAVEPYTARMTEWLDKPAVQCFTVLVTVPPRRRQEMISTTQTSKKALREMGQLISENIGGKAVRPFVGTWMERPGSSTAINLQSKDTGRRVVIHKWDDENTCSVRFITGDFWRDPDNAHTFGESNEVPFTVEAISDTASALLAATREP